MRITGLLALPFFLVGGSRALNQVTFEEQPGNCPRASTFYSNVHGGTLQYVVNSGVCETTSRVGQTSGYVNLTEDASMFFWFFESRSDPHNAPFTVWINGRPGCTAKYDLFHSHGPCQVNGNMTTSIRQDSWNSITHVLYLDQPAGLRFSHDNKGVDSSHYLVQYVWKALQILLESAQFSRFANRRFILASEGYGGHFAPHIIEHFNEQNRRVWRGDIKGRRVVFDSLILNNFVVDPLTNMASLFTFVNYAPGYGILSNEIDFAYAYEAHYRHGGCRDMLYSCRLITTSNIEMCNAAHMFCNEHVVGVLIADRHAFDFRRNSTDIDWEREAYVDYLNDPAIQCSISAEGPVESCKDSASGPFLFSADGLTSSLPVMSRLLSSGLRILLWAGEADMAFNWAGCLHTAKKLDWYGQKQFAKQRPSALYIAGERVAEMRVVDNLSFARVFNAGHDIARYRPHVAFEIYRRFVLMGSLR